MTKTDQSPGKPKLRIKLGQFRELNGIMEGVIDATVAQREFDMGYKSVELIYRIANDGEDAAMSAMGVVDGIIDTGVDVITPANLQEYEAGLDAKGIPHEWDTEGWEPPE